MGRFIPQHSLKVHFSTRRWLPFDFVFTTLFSLPPTFALYLYESHLLLFQLSYTTMRSSIYFLLALISSPALAAPTFVLKRDNGFGDPITLPFDSFPGVGLEVGPVTTVGIIDRTSIPSGSFPLEGVNYTPNF
ncbi:hypothetical protein BC827DRAFT_1273994 [Russula dissimulans]|nr:hypothetical protein BC827DRAFT_1273994 [Russula dissimulans]